MSPPITEQTILSIRNTLCNYPIALDTKNFALLSSVFSLDVRCNYAAVTPQHPEINGLEDLIKKLKVVLEGKSTQHALSTQRLTFHDDGKTCDALTYFTTNTFSEREDGGLEHVTVFGYYEDKLVEGEEGWRIVERKLNSLHPRIRNNSTIVE
ncbi:hypothetical protein EJ08DRAFT_465726 [Tothia fuscella]|uniref:SnoaL-like domain-containing protein n=1 Tax=Tothia fuscella TaxID=1048955 RepID=A0A9P4U2Y0_9PEZI|nr:hypothetical protein EJ08DRAFT_465726 [Tothia fuscella]